MRFNVLILAASLALPLIILPEANGQLPPSEDMGFKTKGGDPLDMDRELLRQIREAYKAGYEVPEDVLKDLRKSYQQPSEKREASIFRDLRRLYMLTEQQEQLILREIRRAYEQPSTEQEQRIFRAIETAERLPEGTVSPTVQRTQAERLFNKLDLNEDGRLSPDELPEPLRSDRARWDRDRDGFIDPSEYWNYYRSRLRWLSDEVAAGRIELGLKRGGPMRPPPPLDEDPRPTVYRAGKLPKGLPDWFEPLDFDKDGQIALFEWRKGGMPLEKFMDIDRNVDGFVTVEEALRYTAQARQIAAADTRATPTIPEKGKRKNK